MYMPKTWGHEDQIANEAYGGKILSIRQQFHSSVHCHKSKDEILVVRDGIIWFESGDNPNKLVGGWLSYNDRMRLKPGTWHRFTALSDAEMFEVSNRHDEADINRHSPGGKLSDDAFRALGEKYLRYISRDIVLTVDVAGAIAKQFHDMKATIGFCNGCFDLMHLGHVELLRQAKARCEVLFVGVNSDASVRRIKGENRPFVDQRGRVGMVAANRFVDYVVIAEQSTCLDSVEAINPDVYITTEEYGPVGPEAREVASKGKQVAVIPMLEGCYNTTRISRTVAPRAMVGKAPPRPPAQAALGEARMQAEQDERSVIGRPRVWDASGKALI